MFGEVSEILPSVANGYLSFFVPSDGSKEGWEESHQGDANRNVFVAYLQTAEGGNVKWAEVQYGDEEGDNKITRSDADYVWIRGQYSLPQPVRVRRRMIDLG